MLLDSYQEMDDRRSDKVYKTHCDGPTFVFV